MLSFDQQLPINRWTRPEQYQSPVFLAVSTHFWTVSDQGHRAAVRYSSVMFHVLLRALSWQLVECLSRHLALTPPPSLLCYRFMPPDDPLGRNGPTLDNFLRKSPRPSESLCPYGKVSVSIFLRAAPPRGHSAGHDSRACATKTEPVPATAADFYAVPLLL